MVSNAIPQRPRLRADVVADGSTIELHTSEGILDVEPPPEVTAEQLVLVLRHLDGQREAREVAPLARMRIETLEEVLRPAVAIGLVDDDSIPCASAGLAVLSRLECVYHELLEELVFSGPFWRAMLDAPESLPQQVFFGFGLENWFFLNSETTFDAPVVCHPSSARLRWELQEFFHEEHRHDDIVVRAFEPLGIDKGQLLKARPLPTTTALINLLSWWARTDPLFFMATVGILEGRLETESEEGPAVYDSFLAACARVDLPAGFVDAMRAHAKVNASHAHGSVSRELFTAVEGVDPATEHRWLGKARLFLEVYAGFFNGILDYYGDESQPLLRVPDTPGAKEFSHA